MGPAGKTIHGRGRKKPPPPGFRWTAEEKTCTYKAVGFDSMTASSVSRLRKKLEPVSDGAVVHVGIDENGLGPVLGPLIVTGVAFRFAGPRPSSMGSLVGDSKALVSHEDPSLGEAWARALLIGLGRGARTPGEVLAQLCLDDESTLRAPCPSHPSAEPDHEPHAMCWPNVAESFVADDAMVNKCLATIRGWTGEKVGGRFVRRTPLELVSVRTSIVCASRLNAAASEGRHRFLVDLHEMERIALRLHEESGSTDAPLDAVCGKVGGMHFYGDNFGPLSSRMYAIEAEGNRVSAYRFPGLGRVSFVQDADARDPLVGLASLVGKWVRELTMGRIVRYLRASASPEHLGPNQELPSASGYRDPDTKRLIAATELVRAHRGVPDRCFLR